MRQRFKETKPATILQSLPLIHRRRAPLRRIPVGTGQLRSSKHRIYMLKMAPSSMLSGLLLISLIVQHTN